MKSIVEQIGESIKEQSIFNRLPKSNSNLVSLYIRQASAGYNIDGARNDVISTVELLSIAYSATPQKAGVLRVAISDIQQDVIAAQGNSELAMNDAYNSAKNMLEDIEYAFEDWNDASDKQAFLTEDFSDLVTSLQKKAADISYKLKETANIFGSIHKKTSDTTSSSEFFLGTELDIQQKIEEEIMQYQADEAELESLITGLQAAIAKFNKRASDFAAQAKTAENRAFISGIIQTGATAISSVVSAYTMGSAGVALNALNSKSSDASSIDQTDSKMPISEITSDKNAAELETEIITKQRTVDESQKKVDDLSKTVGDAESKVKTQKDKNDDTSTGKATLTQLEVNLEQQKTTLAKEKEDLSTALRVLAATKALLQQTAAIAEEIRSEQKDQAAGLRALQAEALKKVDEYEAEKIKQDAKLVRTAVLLRGRQTKKSTITLSVQSLNLSVTSLKKVQSIISEVAFFFENFSNFLKGMAEQADRMAGRISNYASKTDRETTTRRIVEFFIGQYGQWLATQDITSRFQAAFQDGRIEMNRLSGKYLSGDELKEYLLTAADRIDDIATAREKASKVRITNIQDAKKELCNASVT